MQTLFLLASHLKRMCGAGAAVVNPTTSTWADFLLHAPWTQEGKVGSPGLEVQSQSEQLLLLSWPKIPRVCLTELHFLRGSGKAPRFHGSGLFL